MLAAHPAGQAARAPRRLPAVTLTVIPPAARPRHAQAARAPSPPALAPRPARPLPRAGAGGAGPHRRPGSAADHRPATADAGALAPGGVSARATARHPVLRARTPTVLHGPVAGAAAPALTASGRCAAAREPRPCSAGPQIIAAGIPAPAGVPALAMTFLPGRIRQGPSMYEMEGPCPASPRPADQLAGFAGAARRPPGPGTRARGRSPGSSRVPGVAPGWCPFPTVKAFLLPPRAPRKALRPAISCFSAIHEGIHRKQAVIRISQRLSTGLFTACPQCYRV